MGSPAIVETLASSILEAENPPPYVVCGRCTGTLVAALHRVVASGNVSAVERLLKRGLNLSRKTFLFSALRAGPKMLRLLLNYDKKKAPGEYFMLVITALNSRNTKALRVLKEFGARIPNTHDCMHNVIRERNLEMVRFLREYVSDESKYWSLSKQVPNNDRVVRLLRFPPSVPLQVGYKSFGEAVRTTLLSVSGATFDNRPPPIPAGVCVACMEYASADWFE